MKRSVDLDLLEPAALDEMVRHWPLIEAFLAARPRYLRISLPSMQEAPYSQLWHFLDEHSEHTLTVRRVRRVRPVSLC